MRQHEPEKKNSKQYNPVTSACNTYATYQIEKATDTREVIGRKDKQNMKIE